MGKYTVSVKEIITLANAGAFPGEPLDLRNDTRMVELAKGVLFDNTLNQIDEAYQDVFALGFTRHFFNREIAADDLAEFRFWVGEDILNNASYINGIYKALEQGVFSEYRVTDNTRSTSESRNETADESIDRSDQLVTDGEVKETGTTATDSDTSSITAHDTLVTDASDTATAKTGADTLKRTGTEGVVTTDGVSTTNSGDDTVLHTGDVTTAKDETAVDTASGTDKTTYGRKDQRSGATTTDYGPDGLQVSVDSTSDTDGDSTLTFPGGRSAANTGGTTTKFSDTPDNALANAISGDYLTNVTVVDDNTTTTQTGSEKTENNSDQTDSSDTVTKGLVTNGDNTATQASGDDTVLHGKKNTATTDATDTTTYDESTKTSHGLSTVVDGDGTATTTLNTDDTTEYGSEETTGVDSTSATTGTDTVTEEAGGTTTRDLKTETDQTDIRTGNDTRSTDTTGETVAAAEGNEKSLLLQYDMVMRATPLLDKVWLLFADDFMQVF